MYILYHYFVSCFKSLALYKVGLCVTKTFLKLRELVVINRQSKFTDILLGRLQNPVLKILDIRKFWKAFNSARSLNTLESIIVSEEARYLFWGFLVPKLKNFLVWLSFLKGKDNWWKLRPLLFNSLFSVVRAHFKL